MTAINAPLLNELLRPQKLEDLNLPAKTVARLLKMQETGFPLNMIFYGKPGIGKSSAARVMLKNSDVYEINGSHNSGDKTMVNAIQTFCSTMSLIGKPKVVFIDEVDFMPRNVQDALRYTIEQVSGNARFIMTANDYTKMTSAIKSRCVGLCFDVSIKERDEVIDKMLSRYEQHLKSLKIKYDPTRLREILGIYFPDLRAVANQIDFEFAG
jgi:DNA polymerase III delta prime subunit